MIFWKLLPLLPAWQSLEEESGPLPLQATTLSVRSWERRSVAPPPRSNACFPLHFSPCLLPWSLVGDGSLIARLLALTCISQSSSIVADAWLALWSKSVRPCTTIGAPWWGWVVSGRSDTYHSSRRSRPCVEPVAKLVQHLSLKLWHSVCRLPGCWSTPQVSLTAPRYPIRPTPCQT